MGERTDMTRSAAVAGYFYSREADALRGEITALMREGAALRERQAPGLAGLFGQGTTLPGGARHPLMVLLPHAGYMYSGAVACAALAGVELPRGVFGIENKICQELAILKAAGVKNALCPDLGAVQIARAAGLEPYGDFGLNVFNSRTAHLLPHPLASFELRQEDVNRLAANGNDVGALVYGHLP